MTSHCGWTTIWQKNTLVVVLVHLHTETVRKLLNGIESIAYPPRVDVPKPECCRQTPKRHRITQTYEAKVASEALHMQLSQTQCHGAKGTLPQDN